MIRRPNRKALQTALDIFRDVMRPFIVRHLDHEPHNDAESAIREALLASGRLAQFEENLRETGDIAASIDINDFPHLIEFHWSDTFSTPFKKDKMSRPVLLLITNGRNKAAHPGTSDLELEFVRTQLFHIIHVLQRINKLDEAKTVLDIRDSLITPKMPPSCAYCDSGNSLYDDTCPVCGMTRERVVLPPGTSLQGGRFTLGRVLGEGGFGIIYKGAHKPLQRVVAIKELFPVDAYRQGHNVLVRQQRQIDYGQQMVRFMQEARHLAQLDVAGIVDIYDTFQENNTVYMVMEYLEGQTLRDRIRERGPLTSDAVHQLALTICEALAVLHAQQLVHRDLKPGNVMLTRNGRTVLIGFWSASQYEADRAVHHTRITARHTRIRMEDYAAPEQYQGGRFGPYTDIFALGATLYYALTGSLPPSAMERWQRSDRDLPLPAGIKPELAQAIEQALRLQVSARPPTVEVFRQLLEGRTSTVSHTQRISTVDCSLTPQVGSIIPRDRLPCPILASGGGDGTVQLWDVRSGQCRHRLEGHTERVTSMVFSPDGHALASGGGDRTVRLWDVRSGRCRHRLKGHMGAVHAVVFSPDGHTLASGGGDRTVRLWDVAGSQCRHRLEGHTERVFTVVFSPDGHTLASGGGDRTVRLWDVAGSQCRHRLEGHTERVTSVVFSPDGHTLASRSGDGTVRLWDVGSGQCRHRLEDGGISVVFNPDGSIFASGGKGGTVRLWDVGSGQCRHKLEGHKGRMTSVVFSPDGSILASGGKDGTVRLWDVGSGQCRHKLEGHKGRMTSVVFSPDGSILASGGKDDTVRLWDVGSGQCRHILRHEGVLTVIFRPGGSVLANGRVGNDDSAVRL